MDPVIAVPRRDNQAKAREIALEAALRIAGMEWGGMYGNSLKGGASCASVIASAKAIEEYLTADIKLQKKDIEGKRCIQVAINVGDTTYREIFPIGPANGQGYVNHLTIEEGTSLLKVWECDVDKKEGGI